MARGSGRGRRDDLLAALERVDPARHAELLELRRYDPQEFRKVMRSLGRRIGVNAPVLGEDAIPRPSAEEREAFVAGVAETLLAGAADKRRR